MCLCSTHLCSVYEGDPAPSAGHRGVRRGPEIEPHTDVQAGRRLCRGRAAYVCDGAASRFNIIIHLLHEVDAVEARDAMAARSEMEDQK